MDAEQAAMLFRSLMEEYPAKNLVLVKIEDIQKNDSGMLEYRNLGYVIRDSTCITVPHFSMVVDASRWRRSEHSW